MYSEDEQIDDRLLRAIARAEIRTRERIIRLLEAENLLDVETLRAEERLRVVAAVERQAQFAEAALKLQERQAAASEALVTTLQSVVGSGANVATTAARLKPR